MKRKDVQALREKSLDGLRKEAVTLKAKKEKIVVDIRTAKEKNLKKVKNLARDLAQLFTIIREKEIVGKEDQT